MQSGTTQSRSEETSLMSTSVVKIFMRPKVTALSGTLGEKVIRLDMKTMI